MLSIWWCSTNTVPYKDLPLKISYNNLVVGLALILFLFIAGAWKWPNENIENVKSYSVSRIYYSAIKMPWLAFQFASEASVVIISLQYLYIVWYAKYCVSGWPSVGHMVDIILKGCFLFSFVLWPLCKPNLQYIQGIQKGKVKITLMQIHWVWAKAPCMKVLPVLFSEAVMLCVHTEVYHCLYWISYCV